MSRLILTNQQINYDIEVTTNVKMACHIIFNKRVLIMIEKKGRG
jgi:hypothetical protein